MPAVMCMADTSTMPSSIPLLYTIDSTCGVMCTYSRWFSVLKVRYSVCDFIRKDSRTNAKERLASLPAPWTLNFLPQAVFHFCQPVRPFEDFSRTWTVSGAHNPILFHQVDEVRCAAVADSQTALEQGGGRLAALQNNTNGVLVEFVAFVIAFATFAILSANAVAFFLWSVEERLVVLS